MVDIVDLRIEAENLASERLVQVANDVQGLGRTANQAQERLEQLEITRNSLDSFIEAKKRVSDLEEEVAQATVEYQTLQRELRNATNATDEQRLAVTRQGTTLRGLRSDLTRTNTEYRTLRESLRAVGVNTQAFRQEQQRLATETASQRVEAERLSATYDQQTTRLRAQIDQQRELRQETERQEQAQRELRQEAERAGAANAEKLSQQRRQTEEQGRLTIATARYEQGLRKLAQAQAEGNLTRGNYIRGEARLRKELQLTGSQVDTSRRAVEADTKTKLASTRSTDALTKVTRRLAQAYTVLIAAQAAASSVAGNVTAYGQLEAAITNVERTTGIAREQVVEMADAIRELGAEVTPTSSAELLRFAEIAGQLGTTSTEDILLLVNAAEQLGVATNIAGDEAATLLSRILQSTGEGIPAIGNLSSSVVELGNNFAAREDEIVNFTREIVTATRDINLSSAAAAGLGTTLAVAGQRAEASRTAISRLSQAIRRAGTEGGESLERLAAITGQTTDQLQENLGTRSEQIILDFVRGLARVQEQGGVTLDVLRQFGIDGQEAAGVFNGLTAQVGTLAKALDASGRAYRDGLAQVREASNVYANQESAVGRLRNQFQNLREDLGEAFSDETNATINLLSDSLDGTGDSLINLFEILPDVIVGIGELSDSFSGILDMFGADGVGVLEGFAETITVIFNLLDNRINSLVLSFQELVVGAVRAAEKLASMFGKEFDTTYLDGFDAAIARTRGRIVQNNKDIDDSIDRFTGNSSRSYQDLISTVSQYEGVINRLSEGEQAAIRLITEKTGFIQGEDSQYRSLTAAIVRASRAQTIENEQLDIAVKARVRDAEARRQQIKAIADTTQALDDSIASNNTLGESQAQLERRQRELRVELEAGNITREEYNAFNAFINQSLNLVNDSTTELSETQEQQRISTEQLLAQTNQLYAEYKAGTISIAELRIQEEALLAQYQQANPVIDQLVSTTQQYSEAQLRTKNAILRTLDTIHDLRQQLEAEGNSKQDIIRINSRLAESERELADLRAEEALQAELAASSFQELNLLRQQAEQQLARLSTEFQRGAITAGEYAEQQKELQLIISDITNLIGANTDVTEDNTKAIKDNVDAKNQQATASQRVASFASLELQAYADLNKEFDFTDQSTEQLGERVRELTGFIQQNSRVSSVWLRNLAEISNQGFEREQQFIRETIALRQWQEQVESGNLSLEQLDSIAKSASFNIRALGDEQLAPLRNAIAEARREFEELNNTINSALDDTQDRLDAALGNQAAIVTRRFERERDELEILLNEATESGNDALVRQVRQALQNLQRAQRLEFEQQFGKGSQSNNTNQNNIADTGSNQNNAGNNRSNGGTITVNVNTPNGRRQIQVADQASANALLATFEDFGTVSQQGNV